MAKSTTKVSIVIEDLNAFVQKTMAALALQILANLVAAPSRGGTPVDTGWARANWVPNIGSPLQGVVGAPGKPNNAAQTSAQASLIRYSLGQGPIYITNNVPYIGRLNAGSSKQAAAGFIQSAVARASKTVASRRAP